MSGVTKRVLFVDELRLLESCGCREKEHAVFAGHVEAVGNFLARPFGRLLEHRKRA